MNKLILSGWGFILFFLLTDAAIAAGQGELPNGRPFIALRDQMGQMESTFSSLQEQIDALVGRVTSLEDRIGANKAAIEALQAENADLKQQIDANAGGIEDLQAEFYNNLQLIEALQDEIVQINQEIAFKQDLVSGNCPEGMSLRMINADGSVECTVPASSGSGGVPGVTQVRVFKVMDVPPGKSNFAVTVTCPEGFILTGGGGETTLELIGTRPFIKSLGATTDNFASFRTWAAIATNRSTMARGLTAVAACLRLE